MSDDTFIREVNEEMRHERASAVWKRFGKFVIAGVVLVIVGTIAYVLWERHIEGRAAADGDRFFSAVDLAEAGESAAAMEAFEALVDNGVGAYPHLARMRMAAALEASGDTPGAIAALDGVIGSNAPRALRDAAAVRAAYLLVDTGTPADVRQRVERLTGEAEPLRYPAREALGLSLWGAGEGEAARAFFTELTDDLSTPAGIQQRAQLMLKIIGGGVGEGDTPAPATGALPAAPAAVPADTPAAVPVAPAGPQSPPAAGATTPPS